MKLPRDKPIGETLSALVDKFVKETNRTKTEIANEIGVDGADLNRFLRHHRALPPFALASLADILSVDPSEVLLLHESEQIQQKLKNLSGGKYSKIENNVNRVRGMKLAVEAIREILSQYEPHQENLSKFGLLTGWQNWIASMTVFLGDRRETPPSIPADLLAVSASMGDLYNFAHLRLPAETVIRSDKTCSYAKDETLRAMLGDRDLLVIGSPAANLVAREVNSGACFSFASTTAAMAHLKEFQEGLEPIRYDKEKMKTHNPTAYHNVIFTFARSGILDPVDYDLDKDKGKLRGTVTKGDVDYGVVTLCRHPWSQDRVAIMAAGLHGPGTAAAVKILSDERAFEHHPLGGVFKVHIPADAPWEERYQHLSWEWDTHSYTLESYRSDVEAFLEAKGQELNDNFRYWDPEEVLSLLDLIEKKRDSGSMKF